MENHAVLCSRGVILLMVEQLLGVAARGRRRSFRAERGDGPADSALGAPVSTVLRACASGATIGKVRVDSVRYR